MEVVKLGRNSGEGDIPNSFLKKVRILPGSNLAGRPVTVVRDLRPLRSVARY